MRHAYRIRGRLVELAMAGIICERDFYRIASVLTPQSRSAIWQNYFIKAHGGRRVRAAENRGDFEKNGMVYEYKASSFNEAMWSTLFESICGRIAITLFNQYRTMVLSRSC